MTQMVKNQPAMQDTQVQSLGWEDALEKEMTTHSSIPAWKTVWTGELACYSSWGHSMFPDYLQLLQCETY